MIAAPRAGGIHVTYQPAHVAMNEFPATADALRAFDVVFLSDIGANTLLLPHATFARSEPTPNRPMAIRAFVAVREIGNGRSAIFASDCGPH